jgi:hypothetical protein
MRRSIFFTAVLALGLAAAPGFARAGGGFNQKSISGGYSLKLSGWDLAAPTSPVSIIGNIVANRGAISGNIQINDGGVNCSTSIVSGSSYQVNKDGTGTLTTLLNTGSASCGSGSIPVGTLVFAFTIVNNGYALDLSAQHTYAATMVLSGSATFQGRIK